MQLLLQFFVCLEAAKSSNFSSFSLAPILMFEQRLFGSWADCNISRFQGEPKKSFKRKSLHEQEALSYENTLAFVCTFDLYIQLNYSPEREIRDNSCWQLRFAMHVMQRKVVCSVAITRRLMNFHHYLSFSTELEAYPSYEAWERIHYNVSATCWSISCPWNTNEESFPIT